MSQMNDLLKRIDSSLDKKFTINLFISGNSWSVMWVNDIYNLWVSINSNQASAEWGIASHNPTNIMIVASPYFAL